MSKLVFDQLFAKLRHPYLFGVLLCLLVVDLVVPDPIPLVDEALLALLTLLVGTWKQKGGKPAPGSAAPGDSAPRDVTDRGSDH